VNATNNFTGAVTVNAGILKPGTSSALGATNGATTIASGATLDFGGAAANAAEGRLYAAPVPMFAKRAGVAPESLTLQRSFAAYDASAEKSARRPVPVRLAPELQALVEGAPSPGRPVRVIDGRVQVKVLLRNTHALTLHRLEAAGLRLNQVAARYVVGSVEVTRLAALAALDGVERVELP